MTGHTHTPAEWAAFLSLGVGFWASCAALLYLLHDADFDPRPLLARARQGAVHAGHDLDRAAAAVGHALAPHAAAVRHALHEGHEAVRDAAALLILLTSRPNGEAR